MKYLTTLLALLILCGASAQSPHTIEQRLLRQFRKIAYWADYHGAAQEHRDDSLQQANDDFQAALLRYMAHNPTTLTCAFPALEKEGLTIATSSDKRLRIYSWDTYTGGTMHFFENVAQYRANGTVSATPLPNEGEGDPGYWYSDLYAVRGADTVFYIGLRHGIFSTRDAYEGVKVFALHDNRLDAGARRIRTRSGLQNTLDLPFDFMSVVDRPQRQLIRYDTATQTLRLPVVYENGTVTKKEIRYRFTGRYFERVN